MVIDEPHLGAEPGHVHVGQDLGEAGNLEGQPSQERLEALEGRQLESLRIAALAELCVHAVEGAREVLEVERFIVVAKRLEERS